MVPRRLCLAICVSAALALSTPGVAIADEFHVVLSGENPEAGRRNTFYADHVLRDNSLYVALLTDGYLSVHGFGGFVPSLVKLDKHGKIKWRRRYASWSPDSIRLHAFGDGLLMLVQHWGRYAVAHREIEVWQLDGQGNYVTRLQKLRGDFALMRSFVDESGVHMILRMRSPGASQTRLVHLGPRGKVLSRKDIPLDPEYVTVTRRRIYILSASMVHVFDKAGNWLNEFDVPDWTSYIAANEDGGVYLVSDIRHPHRLERHDSHFVLRINYRHDRGGWNYRGLHRLAISSISIAVDGGLWVFGESDGFAAMMKFVDGKRTGAIRFSSRLARNRIYELAASTGKEWLIFGATNTPFPLNRVTDAFVVRVRRDGDFLDDYQACAADPDEILMFSRFLSRKAMIEPAWFPAGGQGGDASPFYRGLPDADTWLRPPDRCGVRAKHDYLAFLRRLALMVNEYPPGRVDKAFSINLYVTDVPVPGGARLGEFTPSSVSVEAGVDMAGLVWQTLLARVYAPLDDYMALRRWLYKEAGVSVNLSGSNITTMPQAVNLYLALEAAWRELKPDERRRLEASFRRIRLVVNPHGMGMVDRETEVLPVERIFAYLLTRAIPAMHAQRRAGEQAWRAANSPADFDPDHLMYEAVRRGWPGLFETALEAGADIDSGRGMMLHVAADAGLTEIARLLLDAGADANTLNADGQTALHVALESRSLGVVRVLFDQARLDLGARDSRGRTPLDIANERRYQVPGWVFDSLKARNAPGGGAFESPGYIIAGGGHPARPRRGNPPE